MTDERIKELREAISTVQGSINETYFPATVTRELAGELKITLDALTTLRADNERLRGLLADLRDWHAHTDEDANTVFERVAEAFHADTGMLRPGKSQSPEAYHSDGDRRQAFYKWAKAKHDALTARIVAALEVTRG